MIIYPLNFPTITNLLDFTLREVSVVGDTASSFSGSQQVQAFIGAWWEAEFTIRPLTRPLYDQWGAFFSSLHGKAGTFLMGHPLHSAPSGSASSLNGTPQVDGSDQSSSILAIKTSLGNVSGYLKAGDLFSVGLGATRRMHKVLNDVDLVLGRASLNIWPQLRYAPLNNAPIYFTNPTTQWRLSVNAIQNTITGTDNLYRIPTVTSLEAL